MTRNFKLLDCTLRDGGYYNSWDFSSRLVADYLFAMSACNVDTVEIGFRLLDNDDFKGAHAFSTDDYLKQLPIPNRLQIAVMINGSDLLDDLGYDAVLNRLFPVDSVESRVKIVRIACRMNDLDMALLAVDWLNKRGYRVMINLMQIATISKVELIHVAKKLKCKGIEVLYVADSTGGLTPDSTTEKITDLKSVWEASIGIHAHDNLGLALQNSMAAIKAGVNWVDATVTGMGRGPGNTRFEELMVETGTYSGHLTDLIPLIKLISNHFNLLRDKYKWGTNIYYYLAGKYGIHPTYVQEMLRDERFGDDDILAVVHQLREYGGKSFNFNTLEASRSFYQSDSIGRWSPATVMEDKEVLLLGSGPGVQAHKNALESYIRKQKPLVVALNTQSSIDETLIDLRIACHPVRLLADAVTHTLFPQPLIVPFSNLPSHLQDHLKQKKVHDFGLRIQPGTFIFNDRYCTIPNSLVFGYALAVLSSGKAKRVLMAGFDGYAPGDARTDEVQMVLSLYLAHENSLPLFAVTPTTLKNIKLSSIYGL